MRITSDRWTPWRRGAVGVVAGGLLAGLMAIPAFAEEAPPVGPVEDRVTAVQAWKDGGPAVRRAAEIALAGSDGDVHAFVASGRQAAADADLRAKVEELVAASGPQVRKAATAALAGTIADLRAFLDTGYKVPFADDQQILATQVMAAGGAEVRKAANKAFNGTFQDVNEFLATGQYAARADDDQIKATQLMATGGPEVRAAANTAMNGGVEDVREFLRYGYQTAAAHDAETLTISQLADLTNNAAAQAGEQAKTAQDAAAKALDSSALAKQAAESAAAETRAAQGEAKKASNAAGKATDAAERAAKAARTASTAAASANEAARQAAAAAADAARASSLAESAASIAQGAAVAAAGNAGDAAKARDAAVAAKKASADAKGAGEAAAWAIRASAQADLALAAANQAGANADLAGQAALDASNQAGVSDEAKDRARAAADRAKAAAAEARRASAQVQKIAADAKAAATEAQRASDASAGHAAAAAAAAEQAAAHAGDAATAAATAGSAAAAANTAAGAAADAATQAHKVADIARASDTERLAAQQAAEVAAAQQAYFEEAARTRQAAWEAGKANELAAETQQLLTDATAPGVDQPVALAKGRQAAVRLLSAGGPWTQVAAQSAVEGHDADVLAFLSTDLALGRERDDRAAVTAIATASTKMPQRLAAESAAVGTVEEVRDFLAHGTYPGKDDDDQILATQIMAAGGPEVRKAANTAMNGTIQDIRAFIATGQYTARNDDNDILITQAMAAGGPEVRAAAQAVLSGPSSGFETFLKIGLPKAQQRDAVTAAHVATVASYLQAIDGNVARARQSAAQAAQSYATAQGAAEEAARQAGLAQSSATEAANWATQAAESARQAKISADKAAAYATQARASAANADAAARSADYSATAAAGSAKQAHQYATDAQTEATKARNSATQAGRSAAEAQQAATAAFLAAYKRVQEAGAEGEMQAQSTVVDDVGRVSYVEAVPRAGLQQKLVKDDSVHCIHGDGSQGLADLFQDSAWHRNAAGESVCDVKGTVKVTGIVDYWLRTCHEPGLTIAECQGRYVAWDSKLLESKTLDGEEHPVTFQITLKDWVTKYSPNAIANKILADVLFGDFIDCFKNPLKNIGACAWAASNFIPFGTLAKIAKVGVVLKVAVETGVGYNEARLLADAAYDGIKAAGLGTMVALGDRVAAFRLTLKDAIGTEDALRVLRADPDVSPAQIERFENERAVAQAKRTSCPIPPAKNSFPAGTRVLMGDGTARAIETLHIGDSVTATDPVTGDSGPRTVTNTIYTPDDRNFTGLTIRNNDGTQSVVTATDHHPIWVESTRTWTDAADIHIGDTLRTDTGATAQVASVRHWTGLEPAYNLTVDGLHTYYVLAGDTPLLVHNDDFDLCNVIIPTVEGLGSYVTTGQALMRNAAGDLVHVGPRVLSGSDQYLPALNAALMRGDLGLTAPNPLVKVFPGADHAEPKILWEIVDKPELKGAEIDIVINRPKGTCSGDLACWKISEAILYTDQSLMVRWFDESGVLTHSGLLKGTRVRPQ
ncbi:polymorphic toxin-type HINT domain-containing protein [Kitasatospora herbaricolor]|uniref:polymorphic toxin-type HINT domain-containing protein n=1 Tax=Kitasatospora herbaricolor TaxID=68217 RepID=UPI0036D7BFE9